MALRQSGRTNKINSFFKDFDTSTGRTKRKVIELSDDSKVCHEDNSNSSDSDSSDSIICSTNSTNMDVCNISMFPTKSSAKEPVTAAVVAQLPSEIINNSHETDKADKAATTTRTTDHDRIEIIKGKPGRQAARGVITAESRLKQGTMAANYRQNFEVINKELHCKYCRVILSHSKKSTMDEHLISEKHTNNFNASKKQKTVQPTYFQSLKHFESREQKVQSFREDFVKMLAAANIPAFKVAKMKPFLLQHCDLAGHLPNRAKIHEIVIMQSKKLQEEMKQSLQGKAITVVVDETTDSQSRSVINVVFIDRFNKYLVETVYVAAINHKVLAQVVIKTLNKYDIEYNNVDAIITDNAKYCLSSFPIIGGLCSNSVHMRCWSHIAHLVGSAFCEDKYCEPVNAFISSAQAYFCNSGKRRRRFAEYLKLKGADNQAIPPMYIPNRWGSYFRSLKYWAQKIKHIVKIHTLFQDEEKKKNKKCATITNVSDIIFTEKGLTESLIHIIIFFAKNTITLYDLIRILERTNKPQVHLLYNRIEALKANLKANSHLFPFQSALTKLEHHWKIHPAKELIQAAHYFHPRNAMLADMETPYRDLAKMNHIIPFFELEKDYDELFRQWRKYWNTKHIILEEEKSFDIIQWWNDFGEMYQCERLASIVRRVLSIPVSGVDVERTFNKYRDVFSDRRKRLNEETTSALTNLHVNNHFSTQK
jgi:hypothetical protein